MSIEARLPPPQYGLRLKRMLGGKAGWNGVVLQILFVAVLVWVGYEIVANARSNLAAQRITSGFGFLNNTAGFDVNQTLIPYSGSDSYTRVLLVGVLNTLLVSVIGIVLATILGFLVALGRLSPNALLSRVSGAYVELIRNLPLLFQILFWYLAVLAALPGPRQSISLFSTFFLNNRGFIVPRAIEEPGLMPFLGALGIAIVVSVGLHYYARRELFVRGHVVRIWPYVLGLLIGLPLSIVAATLSYALLERHFLRRRAVAQPAVAQPAVSGPDLGFTSRPRTGRDVPLPLPVRRLSTSRS